MPWSFRQQACALLLSACCSVVANAAAPQRGLAKWEAAAADMMKALSDVVQGPKAPSAPEMRLLKPECKAQSSCPTMPHGEECTQLVHRDALESKRDFCCGEIATQVQCMGLDCFANWAGILISQDRSSIEDAQTWIATCSDVQLPSLSSLQSYADKETERVEREAERNRLASSPAAGIFSSAKTAECAPRWPGKGCPGPRNFKTCDGNAWAGRLDAESECCRDLAKEIECMGQDCFANHVALLLARYRDPRMWTGVDVWKRACIHSGYPPVAAIEAYLRGDDEAAAALATGISSTYKATKQIKVLAECREKWPGKGCPGIRNFESCDANLKAGRLDPQSDCCSDLVDEIACMGQECFANHVGIIIASDIRGGIAGVEGWKAACPNTTWPHRAAIIAYAKGDNDLAASFIVKGMNIGSTQWRYEALVWLFIGGASIALLGTGVCVGMFLLMRRYCRRRRKVLTAARTDVPLCHVSTVEDDFEDLPVSGHALTISLPDESSAAYQQC